jgi:hypothetical protein
VAAKDITSSVANFREAARHLWNCHYFPTLDAKFPFDQKDSFDRVAGELFHSLVLEQFGFEDLALAPESASPPAPMRRLFVMPSAPGGAPILINRDRARSHGYWDHSMKSIRPDEATLLMAGFFDFDCVGLRDFKYLKVFIAAASPKLDIAGRWALFDFEYARISIDEPFPL